jgi:hypothetical protein
MQDLWPDDIAVLDTKPPTTILKEQATLLGEKTKNIITAEVEQIDHMNIFLTHDENGKDMGKDIKIKFGYNFYIVAPALGNYRYELFSLYYDIEMYPLYIFPDEDIYIEFHNNRAKVHRSCIPHPQIRENLRNKFGKNIEENCIIAESEEEFLDALKQIFNAQKTKKIIGSLLAQSK